MCIKTCISGLRGALRAETVSQTDDVHPLMKNIHSLSILPPPLHVFVQYHPCWAAFRDLAARQTSWPWILVCPPSHCSPYDPFRQQIESHLHSHRHSDVLARFLCLDLSELLRSSILLEFGWILLRVPGRISGWNEMPSLLMCLDFAWIEQVTRVNDQSAAREKVSQASLLC